jgi:DNA-binding MarR family transcriptional regulator
MSESVASIRRGTIRLALRLRAERSANSLPPTMLSVLGHLHRSGPLTAGQLAAADRVQPQSLTRTLAALEEQDLIIRRPGEQDRRQSLLGITQDGRRRLIEDMRQRDAWLARAMHRTLSPTERDLLKLAGPLLERLAEIDETG